VAGHKGEQALAAAAADAQGQMAQARSRLPEAAMAIDRPAARLQGSTFRPPRRRRL